MQINFAGTILADFTGYLHSGATMNGQPVIDAEEIVRAPQKTFRYRGNFSVLFQFTVQRLFGTEDAAEIFFLTHSTCVPKAGLCICNCGSSAETATPVYMANALLTAIPTSYSGCEVTVKYSIVAPAATLTTPIGYITGGGSVMVQQGTPALTMGATHIDVVFPTIYTTMPSINVGVMGPLSGVNILAVVRNPTAAGFSAYFAAPIPASGYYLSWASAGT